MFGLVYLGSGVVAVYCVGVFLVVCWVDYLGAGILLGFGGLLLIVLSYLQHFYFEL